MRALACLLLLSSCAAQRLNQARFTGASAMSCAPEDLWVFEDEAGWSATGCGQIVSGAEPGHVTERVKATCDGLARFEFRLCRAIARQSRPYGGSGMSGALMAGIVQAQNENACSDQLAARYASCPPGENGLPAPATIPTVPIEPGEIPPNP